MAITVGDRLPDGTLIELIETETPGCALGPNAFTVSELVKGKRIVVFGLPGAFTPTCSAKHLPGYLAGFDRLKAKQVELQHVLIGMLKAKTLEQLDDPDAPNVIGREILETANLKLGLDNGITMVYFTQFVVQ